jgi:hypothetical protein
LGVFGSIIGSWFIARGGTHVDAVPLAMKELAEIMPPS